MTSEQRREARYQRRKTRRDSRIAARSIANCNFEDVFSYRNLYKSGRLCARNVSWKSSTQQYGFNIVANTGKTRQRLLEGKYRSKGFIEFQLFDRGKVRRIRSVHISERVVQRTLCDKAIIPVFTPAFIYDNGASMTGKGIDFALNRFTEHLQRHYRKHGTSGYVLQFDFKSFFDTANHEPVRRELERRVFDERTRTLANQLLDDFGPVGYGLGSQISQVSALMLPNRLDHVIKEQLRIKGYARYMDDGYLIHESAEYLQECLEVIRSVCADLGITLNEKKTQITPISKGLVFLKTKFILTDNGRVIRKMSRSSAKAMRRKLYVFKKWLLLGKFSIEDIATSYESWRGHMRRGDSFKAVARMDSYFKTLFGFHPNNKNWRRRYVSCNQ